MTKISLGLINTYERMMRVIDIILKMSTGSPFMVIGLPDCQEASELAENLIRLGNFSPRDFMLNRTSDELVLVEQGETVRTYSRE